MSWASLAVSPLVLATALHQRSCSHVWAPMAPDWPLEGSLRDPPGSVSALAHGECTSVVVVCSPSAGGRISYQASRDLSVGGEYVGNTPPVGGHGARLHVTGSPGSDNVALTAGTGGGFITGFSPPSSPTVNVRPYVSFDEGVRFSAFSDNRVGEVYFGASSEQSVSLDAPVNHSDALVSALYAGGDVGLVFHVGPVAFGGDLWFRGVVAPTFSPFWIGGAIAQVRVVLGGTPVPRAPPPPASEGPGVEPTEIFPSR